MPKVSCPHALYNVTFHQLTNKGIDPVATPIKQCAPLWSGIMLFQAVGKEMPKDLRHDHLPGPKGVFNARTLLDETV